MSTSVAEIEFKSPKRLGLTIQILTVVVAGLHICGMYLVSPSRGAQGADLKNTTDELSFFGNLAQIVAFPLVLLLLSLIITWLRRVIRNMPALGAQGAKAKDWHAFMFIVPIVNLLWPMITLHEVWKASDPEILDPKTWKDQAPSGLINTWWTIMILNMGLSIPMEVHMVHGDLRTRFGLASLLLNLAFQAAFMLVVGNISARQERKHLAALGLSAVFPSDNQNL